VLAAQLSPAELHSPSRQRPTRPQWCGECDERTRLLDFDGDAPRPCPICRPAGWQRAAALADTAPTAFDTPTLSTVGKRAMTCSGWVAALVTEVLAPSRALGCQVPGPRDRATVEAQPDFFASLTCCPTGGLLCRIRIFPTPWTDPAVMSWPLRVSGGCGCRLVFREAICLVAESAEPLHHPSPPLSLPCSSRQPATLSAL